MLGKIIRNLSELIIASFVNPFIQRDLLSLRGDSLMCCCCSAAAVLHIGRWMLRWMPQLSQKYDPTLSSSWLMICVSMQCVTP